MVVTREAAAALLGRAHAVLDAERLPALSHGLCNLLVRADVPDNATVAEALETCTVYGVIDWVFNGEIPCYRDPQCPPEWQRCVWSAERMTLLCMFGALSADDIVEMCQ